MLKDLRRMLSNARSILIEVSSSVAAKALSASNNATRTITTINKYEYLQEGSTYIYACGTANTQSTASILIL